MLEDKLANEGVANKVRDSQHSWDLLPAKKLREDCVMQENLDWDAWMEITKLKDRGEDKIT